MVKRQDGFFRRGVAELKPLTLRAVADAIDMHESTVSRVTSNKYLHCPLGTWTSDVADTIGERTEHSSRRRALSSYSSIGVMGKADKEEKKKKREAVEEEVVEKKKEKKEKKKAKT